MSFKATRNRIIVEFINPEQRKSVIVIPDKAKPLPTAGVVVSIGECRTWGDGIPLDPCIEVGDVVLFPARAAQYLDDQFIRGSILVQDVMAKLKPGGVE